MLRYFFAINPDRPRRQQMRTPWDRARYGTPVPPARDTRQQRRLREQHARRQRNAR